MIIPSSLQALRAASFGLICVENRLKLTIWLQHSEKWFEDFLLFEVFAVKQVKKSIIRIWPAEMPWLLDQKHWIPIPTMHLGRVFHYSCSHISSPPPCLPPAAAPLTSTNWPLSGCWTRRATVRRSQWSVVQDLACWLMELPTNRPSGTRTSPTSPSAQVSRPRPRCTWSRAAPCKKSC